MLLRQLFKQAGNVVQISSFEGGVCFHRLGLGGLRMVVGKLPTPEFPNPSPRPPLRSLN